MVGMVRRRAESGAVGPHTLKAKEGDEAEEDSGDFEPEDSGGSGDWSPDGVAELSAASNDALAGGADLPGCGFDAGVGWRDHDALGGWFGADCGWLVWYGWAVRVWSCRCVDRLYQRLARETCSDAEYTAEPNRIHAPSVAARDVQGVAAGDVQAKRAAGRGSSQMRGKRRTGERALASTHPSRENARRSL